MSCNEQSTFDYNKSAKTGVVKMKRVPFSEALALIVCVGKSASVG